ncbi:citrate synthase/methylcitrate synthase [Methylacidiphilum caldifontis]|uniref:Citrate synthase n=1 Tax=Methylacidiphilum caldifontis TaxID=2795386 RepID=A0A4Y8PFG3_9BACT|nr:citrate synthase/methylcitrate synthase [Methylacidiphilum caldifontis]QSR88276.1 citrate synthase/methylcitrate synthase [Methylacidiphilum caldifontis]TFE70587.1 2-methylcitrate synthase [Methylacidiphilum caldifontis]
MTETIKGGLEGIIAGKTSISTVGKEGLDLTYRGYSIHDLAKKATFEEVVFLLLYNKLPTKSQLNTFIDQLASLRELPSSLQSVLKLIPKETNPMDVLRTGCSMLGTLEPEEGGRTQEDIAKRLLAVLPSMLLYWYQYHKGKGSIETTSESEKTIASHLLHLLYGHPANADQIRALDVALILHAEHEFNASTFTCRVITSTLSDFYSAITGGICALRGPLHGGADEAAMEQIGKFQSVEEAEQGVKAMLSKKEKIMGFGHRVYKYGDPRSDIIKEWAKNLSVKPQYKVLFSIAEKIEEVMFKEKHLYPNVDFYSALTYHFLGIPTLLFTPLFVISRTAGWCAHIFEQRANNRLIRPIAEYVGPLPMPFIPIEERTL